MSKRKFKEEGEGSGRKGILFVWGDKEIIFWFQK